ALRRRGRRRGARAASRFEREPDVAIEDLPRHRSGDVVADDAPAPVDEERLREAGDAVVADDPARAVVDERVRDLVPPRELAGVAVEVLGVEAEEDDAARAPPAPAALELVRLLL